MPSHLRALVSALTFGELRMSGVSSRREPDGGVRTLRVERIEVHEVDLKTALGSMHAASVELSDTTVRLSSQAPSAASPQPLPPGLTVDELRLEDASIAAHALPLRAAGAARHGWRLDPLGSLDGTLHAQIVDAAWIFDADVTIPIGGGRVDFNRATVEHIGPDSSMGVSRMGVYVDAPNGRTYLFLLSATHVPGVRFERRDGGLLPGWSGDRGAIELQPLLECLLTGLPIGTLATGTRDMAARTRVRGEFRLGDGVVGDERHRLVLAGRDGGRNQVALSSAPSGRGIVLRMAELSASELHWESAGAVVSAGALSATVSVQVEDARPAPAVSVSIAELTLRNVSAVAAPRSS